MLIINSLIEWQFFFQSTIQVNSDSKGLKPTGIFGQCGKRNAHGINGRIAAANPFTDGDTDFGKQQNLFDNFRLHS